MSVTRTLTVLTFPCLQFQKPSNNQAWQDLRQACIDVSEQMTNIVITSRSRENIHSFIPTFTVLITTKFGRMVDQHALTLLCGWCGVTTVKLCDKQLWFYRQFYTPSNKHNSQDCRPACICLSQQVMMKSLS